MLQDCWEAQLRQTVRRFRGGRREIDYAHANAFYTALNRFLTDRLPALLRAKAVMPAFSLVCAVYCTAMEEEADSSDGGMNLLMHTCEDAWHDLAFIHALRGITPDGQWPERLEQLLQLPSTNSIRLELLADSGQWPRLFAELEQRGLLHLLEAYMEPLAAWDAEKTLALFSRLIDTQMARAYDRDSYHRTIDRVRILRRYPGGDRTIARLLQGWKERYPRRTAMLDELNKAKWAGRL